MFSIILVFTHCSRS